MVIELRSLAVINCNICPYKGCTAKFTRPYRLEAHINAKHKMIKPFNCQFTNCNKSFYRKEHLRRHIKSHDLNSNLNKLFQCQKCGKSFTLPQNFKRHYKNCSDNSTIPKEYKCEKCNKMFKKKDSFRRHLFIHTGIKPYFCTYKACFHYRSPPENDDNTLSTLVDNDERALENISKKIRSIPGFMSLPKYTQHLKIHDETSKDFKLTNKSYPCPFPLTECPVWRKKTNSYLNKPAKNKSDLVLNMGPIEYKSQKLLSQHIKLFHGSLIQCPVCKRGFLTQRGLTRHIKKYGGLDSDPKSLTLHNELNQFGKPGVIFECPNTGCTKYYLHRRNLNYHLKKTCKFNQST